MFIKIFFVTLSMSTLMSCQQEPINSVDKTSANEEKVTPSEISDKTSGNENLVSKSEKLKANPKNSLTKVDIGQLSFIATIRYMNIEGGFFGVISKDGKRWLPLNLKKEFQQDGAIIKVTGSAVNDMMTIQQWGTPFSITHIELIKAGSKGIQTNII